MLTGIYSNPERDEKLATTEKLIGLLRRASVPFVLHSSLRGLIDGVSYFGDDCEPRPDVIVTLGGDGTILSAVAFAAEKGIPVLGINLGHIGFLSACGTDALDECVVRLAKGDYSVRRLAMLETYAAGKRLLALNEIVIYKKNVGKTVTLTVKVGGGVLSSAKCDGCMVSTPTGSTGYALSAGGPIVDPGVRCNLVVPINCHHLSTKPVIVDASQAVEITSDEETCIIADGRVEDGAHSVVVRRSDVEALLVDTGAENFYARLREKLDGSVEEV